MSKMCGSKQSATVNEILQQDCGNRTLNYTRSTFIQGQAANES